MYKDALLDETEWDQRNYCKHVLEKSWMSWRYRFIVLGWGTWQLRTHYAIMRFMIAKMTEAFQDRVGFRQELKKSRAHFRTSWKFICSMPEVGSETWLRYSSCFNFLWNKMKHSAVSILTVHLLSPRYSSEKKTRHWTNLHCRSIALCQKQFWEYISFCDSASCIDYMHLQFCRRS